MHYSTPIHSGWEFAERTWVEPGGGKLGTSQLGWLPAQAPGHVHIDLVENGVIEDPFWRMNELGCQWVDEKDWIYRTTFRFVPDHARPNSLLRFEGLDTIADVFLNGEFIGHSENMFVPLEIDVASKLIAGDNKLRVEFSSAVRIGQERREKYFAHEGLKPETLNFSERAFVRKAQYMSGWDWGPRLVSCGIWRPVYLVQYASRFLDVHVVQQHGRPDGSVLLEVASEFEGRGSVSYGIRSPFSEASYDNNKGVILIEDPEYWEPNGIGDPNLYTLTAFLYADEAKKELLDIRRMEVGLRTIRLLREKDEHGESFEFEVNGKKIWARGANWIPDHSFPSIVSKNRYREQLLKAVDMGCNMLRVWGGGLYETDEFYEICDELGLLVWQDFPFGCSFYPDDAPFQQVVADEAYINVKRLRNHASLALWCGNNENHQMWFDKWGGPDLAPPRYYGRSIYHQTLPGVLSKLDPNTPYIPSSGIGATDDDENANPNRGGFGDQHNWDVWHGRGDWRYYAESTARFSSEYGFASSCGIQAWSKTLAEEDWDPHSNVVKWHDKTGKGHETFHSFVKLHYPEPETLEDWVYYSQLNQRDALRCGIEHYRRSDFCKGSLIWQINDCWPVQSWAFLDSEGEYKALAYELRRLYDGFLCSIVRNSDEIQLWVANDDVAHTGGLPILQARDLKSGDVLREFPGIPTAIAPGERKIVLTGSIAGLSVPDTILFASFGYADAWQLLAEPKAARFAPPGKLIVSTSEEGELRIQTDTPLVDLWLLDNGSASTFADNFITRDEGVFDVPITRKPTSIQARSLAGEHEVVVTRSPIVFWRG